MSCQVKALLICCVCQEAYDTKEHVPHALKCAHAVCAACLGSLLRVTPRQITCPLCRALTPVLDGVASIPIDRFKRELIDIICNEVNAYCWIAEDAADVSLSQADRKEDLGDDNTETLCSTHGCGMEYYCKEHKLPLCQKCAIFDHGKCSVVQQIVPLRDELAQSAQSLQGHCRRVKRHLDIHDEQLQAYQEAQHKIDRDEKEAQEAIRHHLQEEEKRLMDYLNQVCQARRQQLSQQSNELSLKVAPFRAFLQDALAVGGTLNMFQKFWTKHEYPVFIPRPTNLETSSLQFVPSSCGQICQRQVSIYLNPEALDAHLLAVCQSKKELVRLDAAGCMKLTSDALLAIVRQSPNLTQLNLNRCFFDLDMLKIIADTCPNMTSLDIACAYHKPDQMLITLAQNCPKLTHLDVSGEHYHGNDMGDAACVAIARYLPNLTSLRVDFCYHLSDAALFGLAKCSNLTHLAIGTDEITDSGIIALAKGCPQLTQLDIRGCAGFALQNVSNAAVLAVTEWCPNLTRLRVSSSKLTDVALIALVKRCSKLSALAVPDCRLLTSAALEEARRRLIEVREKHWRRE